MHRFVLLMFYRLGQEHCHFPSRLPYRPRVDYRGYAVAVHRRLCHNGCPHGTSAAVLLSMRGPGLLDSVGRTGRGSASASLGPGRLPVYYSAGRNYSRVRKYQGEGENPEWLCTSEPLGRSNFSISLMLISSHRGNLGFRGAAKISSLSIMA